ncbi:MAG: hypothetical protein WBB82_12415 [Limnothrix sp.]
MNLIFNLYIGGFLTFWGAGVIYAVIVNNLLPLLACKRSAIATAKIGQKIYIVGKYGIGKSTFSPLTKTHCLRWHIVVIETKGSSKRAAKFTLLDQSSTNNFSVIDNSGSIEILPRQRNSNYQTTDPKKVFNLTSNSWLMHDALDWEKINYQAAQNIFQDLTDDRAIAFLAEHNIERTGRLGNRRNLMIKEYVYQMGDPVYIHGKIIRVDRKKKILIPLLMTSQSRFKVILFLGLFLLLGSIFFAIGINALLSLIF